MRSRMLSSSAAGPGAGLDQLLELLEQRDELLDRLERAGGELTDLRAPAQRRGERDPLAVGEVLDAGLRPLADARFGVLMTRRRLTMSVGLATTFR